MDRLQLIIRRCLLTLAALAWASLTTAQVVTNGQPGAAGAGDVTSTTLRVVLADGVFEGPNNGITTTASTNATGICNAPCHLMGYELYNTTTTVYYLRLYNIANTPTCSSTTGFIRSVPIPPASAAGGVGGIVAAWPIGVTYSLGIGYCITGGAGSTDNTNAAIGIFGVIKYRPQ